MFDERLPLLHQDDALLKLVTTPRLTGLATHRKVACNQARNLTLTG